MPTPYSAPMSDVMDLDSGYIIRITAVDPTTGNALPAIVVTSMAMLARPLGDTTPSDLAVGPFLLVPGSGA